MEIAFRVAREKLSLGWSPDQVGKKVKDEAAIAESMRAHLVRMLDGVDVHKHLDIPSCARLFDLRTDLVHSTSAVRYPAFYRGKDYRGRTPPLLRTEALRGFVTKVLCTELRSVPDALIVPMGTVADEVVSHLVGAGELLPERRTVGFPHPSGGNGHREKFYRERREDLRQQVADWFQRAG